MNILHLLSQNQLTGAEVYAVTLAHHQIDSGHEVYQLSNEFFFPTRAVRIRTEVETKSKFTFFKNILWLRNFIRKQNIQVVHTHSRAAAKMAYWALLFSGTAQVSTVHGVQHISFSKKLHNQYGEFIFAVCENIKTHLIRDFSYADRRIKVIPNPVNPGDFYFVPREIRSTRKIAIVGRTTGPKRERTKLVVQALQNENYEITLIGGALADLQLSPASPTSIKELNISGLNSDIYAGFDLIIGAGRVCMEALITGVPVIAFGEAKYLGRITPENFFVALASNFGDIQPGTSNPQLNTAQLLADLNFDTVDATRLSQLAAQHFSLLPIAAKIQRLYESAYFLKNYSKWIPVLMYHKVPDKPITSEHKIFVTKENFEKHLHFYKKRGLETLTFADLQQFRTGKKSFSSFPKKPLLLTFDDGYKDNLDNAAPLLKKYNFTAQVFLLADPKIASNQWDIHSTEPSHEIVSGPARQQWKETPFAIGSHGFAHKKITALDETSAQNELLDSKKILENEFNMPVNVFAFTYGVTTPVAAALAQAAGYDYAVNTDTGGLLLEEEPYSIFRVSVFPNENLWSLFKKTSKWYRKYYRFKRGQ